MVDNNNMEQAPRRRKSLFGARKTKAVDDPIDGAPLMPSGSIDTGAGQPESFEAPADETPPDAAGDDTTGGDTAGTDTTDVDGAVEQAPVEQATVDTASPPARALPSTSLIFQAPDLPAYVPRESSRDDRGGRDAGRGDGGRGDNRDGGRDSGNRRGGATDSFGRTDSDRDRDRQDRDDDESSTVRRRSRRRTGEEDRNAPNPPNTVIKVRPPRPEPELITEPQRIKGSTRLEAKKQRRRDGRDAGRRRTVITEAEFLARRESVDRTMVVRSKLDRIQIGVLEDGVLSEHYVAKAQDASLIGNVYLGRVQNVLPSMEAAFVDIGRGRNAVLYSGEVDWDAAAADSGNGSQARRIELALKPGDTVLVQVTKDPIGHKGARLTSQVSLPGRYLVYVPNGSMNGISRKLPDTERARLKKVLKEVLPENVGVIVRTAAEGATDEQLTLDVNRLTAQWAHISETVEKAQAPALLHSEPDLLVKIIRDVFNEDFQKLVIDGDDAAETISTYLAQIAPDLIDRIEKYEGEKDSFDEYRISEQIEKALDRKVWLPSGGSLVIDRTEAMTVVDVNTGKFVGSGGNLEETVTKNNLEAAEEIVRQMRLRDIGGIIVVDFIDMVLETNRDLVLRRLVECLGRDRTKHQVAEVTSLGLVQMTRKKLGLGLLESFSENCEACAGRGIIVNHDPLVAHRQSPQPETGRRGRKGANTNGGGGSSAPSTSAPKSGGGTHAITDDVRSALAKIATSTITQADAASVPLDAIADAAVAAVIDTPVTPAASEADAPQSGGSNGQQSNGQQSGSQQGSGQQGGSQQGSGQQSGRQSGRREPRRRASSSGSAAPAAITPVTTEQAPAAPGSTPPQPIVVPAVTTDAAGVVTVAEPVSSAPTLIEIPQKKVVRTPRKMSTHDAEQILDSVLDALPEPRPSGQGRSTRTSRRASSSGTVTAEAQGAAPTSAQSDVPADAGSSSDAVGSGS
ncbi:Rne/Rng family ribonuclease [Marisediminicola senii]|uniref:Rne/Rng family ribonuclease n=1 Tax=Marisediminicola senii TaxID=2711233 RepID=UPI0013E9B302|nr:Rne/Rng family ribonuclease [Marisediminicola senii]